MRADIMFSDISIASSKAGKSCSRTLTHGAFYAGARSTLNVPAYMLRDGAVKLLNLTALASGAADQSNPGIRATETAALISGDRQ